MIYKSYLFYHNVYSLMTFYFNKRNKIFINTKDGLLIIKSLKQKHGL
jgi:hypothetical protein